MAAPDVPRRSSIVTVTATIANGESLSDAIDLTGYSLVAIVMPSVWTAANLTFQAGATAAALADVYDSSGELSVTAAASRFITVSPDAFVALRHLKVRSGTTGSPVNQAAERSITLICKASN